MSLRFIHQENDTGCFVACVAMLMGKSYGEAFQLLHPGKDSAIETHGFLTSSIKETAHEQLQKLGFATHNSRWKKFRSFVGRGKKHALMIIRWRFDPTMCHCVVFDADSKDFKDPGMGVILPGSWHAKSLQRQLEHAIIIDHIPQLSESPIDLYGNSLAY